MELFTENGIEQKHLEIFEQLNNGWTLPSLMVPKQRLFRKNFGDGRAYLKPLDQKGTSYQIALGLTSAIPLIVPIDNKQLVDWRIAVGLEASNLIADEARCYGTMMHIILQNFSADGFFDFSELNETVRLMIPQRFNHNLEAWTNRARRNLASIFQWFSDKEVTSVFAEYCVFDSELNIGTYLDLGCELTFNRKRVFANVDFKFSRSGQFSKPYHIQAAFSKHLWNRHAKANGLPETEMTFLLAPKEWSEKKGEPTYNFENATGNIYDSNFLGYMGIWKLEKQDALSKIEGEERYAHSVYKMGETFEKDKHFTTINYQYQI